MKAVPTVRKDDKTAVIGSVFDRAPALGPWRQAEHFPVVFSKNECFCCGSHEAGKASFSGLAQCGFGSGHDPRSSVNFLQPHKQIVVDIVNISVFFQCFDKDLGVLVRVRELQENVYLLMFFRLLYEVVP